MIAGKTYLQCSLHTEYNVYIRRIWKYGMICATETDIFSFILICKSMLFSKFFKRALIEGTIIAFVDGIRNHKILDRTSLDE